jgi:hypothetical protein
MEVTANSRTTHKLGNQLMAHTRRVLSLSEVGGASAELVSDDFPVFHVAAESKRAGKTSCARAKSERFSTGGSGAQVAEKPAQQAKRLVAAPFNFLLCPFLCLLATIIQKSAPAVFLIR